MIDPTAQIHRAAVIDYPDQVTIGARTKVWSGAVIGPGTVIGSDCTIAANVVLTGPIIGDGCSIGSGCVMGPGFKVGNKVFFGPGVVLANDMYPSVCKDHFDLEGLKSGEKFAIIIEDEANIGANVCILPGTRIGSGALIAACAKVSGNVPPGHIHQTRGNLSVKTGYDLSKRMRWAEEREFPKG